MISLVLLINSNYSRNKKQNKFAKCEDFLRAGFVVKTENNAGNKKKKNALRYLDSERSDKRL